MDEATGLYDYGARYYDPAIARWGQVDPLADQYAPYSPYNYVLGNPIRLVDPDGMRVSLFEKMEAMGANHGAGPDDEEEEEEDCCPGMGIAGAQVRSQNAQSMAESSGDSYESTYLELSQGEIDAGVDGAIEGVMMILGEWAVVKVVQGTKNIYRTIKATRLGRVNLASSSGTRHIIAGDITGGGHHWFGSVKSFWNGVTGAKSMFPVAWSKRKTMHAVSEVLTSNPWIQQSGRIGASVTRKGKPVRYSIIGFYEGVKIKVIATGNDIITAFPLY